jgi:hypothetical protein
MKQKRLTKKKAQRNTPEAKIQEEADLEKMTEEER